MHSFSPRVNRRWHAAYSCTRDGESLLCTRPTGWQPCQSDWSQASEKRKKKSFPRFLSLPSLPISQLYMFNELASCLSVFIPPPPRSSTPSLPLRAHTCFFLRLLFFSIQCSSCWHSQCSEKRTKEKDQAAIKKLFLTAAFHIHCPIFHAKGARCVRGRGAGGEVGMGGADHIVAKVTIDWMKELCTSWGFADLGPCLKKKEKRQSHF